MRSQLGSPQTSPPCDTNPQITVELSGPDTPLLIARNGELLLAIEHIAAKILRLEPEEHDQISFDADGFKATRNRELDLMAEMAIQKVRATGQPFSFSPMTSRERRILHLALAKSGLPTASSGQGPGRFVVLYPEGQEPAPPQPPLRKTALEPYATPSAAANCCEGGVQRRAANRATVRFPPAVSPVHSLLRLRHGCRRLSRGISSNPRTRPAA